MSALLLGFALVSVGHVVATYLAARLFGYRVDVVAVGFGPALFQRSYAGTKFRIGWLPLLSYVQIAGMNPFEPGEPDDAGSFANGSLLTRLLTMLAGPGAMFAAGFCLFSLGALLGYEVPEGPLSVLEVEGPASPALHPGDRVLRVERREPKTASTLSGQLVDHPRATLELRVERAGQSRDVVIRPAPNDDDHELGVTFGRTPVLRRFPVTAVPRQALTQMSLSLSRLVAGVSAAVATRTVFTWPFRLVSDDTGSAPVSLSTKLLLPAGTITVWLGIFNLLPMPALNGGRILLLLYSGLARRALDGKREALLHGCGYVGFWLGVLVLVGLSVFGRPAVPRSHSLGEPEAAHIRAAATEHQIAAAIVVRRRLPEPALRL